MDLGEHMHKLNLLCAANLSNDELCITTYEVNTKYSNDKCKPKSLEVHLFPIIKPKVHNQQPQSPQNKSRYLHQLKNMKFMLYGNRVIDQTTTEETCNNHSSRDSSSPPNIQLNIILLDLTDYLFNVIYVVLLHILLEIAQ